jgi:hypothetical protein
MTTRFAFQGGFHRGSPRPGIVAGYAADNLDHHRPVPIDGVGTLPHGRAIRRRPASVQRHQVGADPLLPSPVPGGRLDRRSRRRIRRELCRHGGPRAWQRAPPPHVNRLCATQLFLRDPLGDWAARVPGSERHRRPAGRPRQRIDWYIVCAFFEPAADVVPAAVQAARIYRSSGQLQLTPTGRWSWTVDTAGVSYVSLDRPCLPSL